MFKNLLICAGAIVAAGCAAPAAETQVDPADKGDYVTGSNIPRKRGSMPDGVQRADPAEVERARANAPMTPPTRGH